MKQLYLFLLLCLAVFSFADTAVSPKQTIVLPKPHDHTGKALDIMVKKDVMRLNYGEILYRKHCASCHHKSRTGGVGPTLSAETLQGYDTISSLYLAIREGCAQSGASALASLGNVKLIFIARYIKRPLQQASDTPISTSEGATR